MGKPKRRANPKVVTSVDRNLAKLTVKEAKKFVRRLPSPWDRINEADDLSTIIR